MSAQIRLRLLDRNGNGQSWQSNARLRIGRLKSLEIALDDSSVSRHHAELYSTARGWRVRDLRSTNGTFLNSTRLGASDAALRLNDVIRCGDVTFVIDSLEIDEPVPEPPCDSLIVAATGKRPWEEAVQGLIFDQNRCPRPGEQLQALLRAGHHLGHIENLDELLDQVLHDAVGALDAQRGAIILAEGPHNQLKLQVVATGRREVPARAVYSKSLAQRCFSRAESILCRSVDDDPELASAQSISQGAMASVLCVLLRTPRRLLGVLHLDRGPTQAAFTSDDLFLADAMAANVSAAVESSLLLQKQKEFFLSTMTALAQAVEMRDNYTGGHTHRVAKYAELLGEELKLSAHDMYWIQMGTPLHDVGKIGIKDSILQKEGPLTAEETIIMQSHTIKGAAILETIPEMEPAVPLARSHHERWDGKGYPDGLAGNDIPRLARIVAVADTFDAMTSDRPYRLGLPVNKGFAELEKHSGMQFDPECVSAFLARKEEVIQVTQTHTCKMAATAALVRPTLSSIQ